MNIGGKLILFFMALMILACQAHIPESETVIRQGVVYQKGEERPFTGFVAGRGRTDYRTKIYRYEKQYKDGMLNGTCKFWYPNGKLESVEPYKNGQINGIVIRYYDNGQTQARIPISNGARAGSAGEFFWDKNGKLITG
jgi:uncharacterized protein